MKRNTVIKPRRLFLLLMIWTLLAGLMLGSTAFTASAAAEDIPTLTPDDLKYENDNIILHKHGERIGPDEWKVTVRATIGETPVEKRKMEVVFLVDRSGSMDAVVHTHTSTCFNLKCEKEEHVHESDCYALACGMTEHNENCYKQNCAGIHEHKDSCYTVKCSNNTHNWLNNNQHRAAGCRKRGNTWYSLGCGQEEHTEHDDSCYTLVCNDETHHPHDSQCYELVCPKEEHQHASGCYECDYYIGGSTNDTRVDRLDIVSAVAERMIASLPAEVTTVTRLAFDAGFTSGISSYYDVTLGSGTRMWDGIYETFKGNFFSTNPDTKKVFVILTDGETSRDSHKTAAQNYLANFKKTTEGGANGAVFTVGFDTSSTTNQTLKDIAGNGGYYMYAEDAESLSFAFNQLEQTLTAMLEDPMGNTVGFDTSSIQEIHTSNGVISNSGDTIYWNPAEDGSTSVNNSVIEYSYTVKLNDQANRDVGVHGDTKDDLVPLNKPTYFYYGIKNGDGTTNMKEALFPIPHAQYALSSIQTKWQIKDTNTDIKDPTEVEKIICDYASGTYIPAFQQEDYKTIIPVIPIAGSNDYYRYVGTTVTANDESLPGVEAVDATVPVAYVVIHQYERVHANELVIGGTKTLIGRDFKPGDSFSFTLTAVEPSDAPMPREENVTVTITPESGTSMAFSFNQISFNQAGTYTYTIQEQVGDLKNVIYDTTKHTLVVTAKDVNNQIVISYTMDGVENGHLMITNRLKTGSLEIRKNRVKSYLDEHQDKPFNFVVNIRDASNRPLSGSYQLKTGSSITFTNGYAALALKAGESAEILGLPDGAAYTVKEDALGGFTATPTQITGTIVADATQTASFDNEYHASGSHQFYAEKKLEGKGVTLEANQYSFIIKDTAGKIVAQGKNNKDGNVYFDMLYFTEADIGRKTYTIEEVPGNLPGILYDKTVYTVKLTIADKRDGTLSITSDQSTPKFPFTNKHITGQLTVSKTVAGNLGSKNKEFPFTLSLPEMAGKTVSVSTDGGLTFTEMTLDAQGTTTFTLRDSQSIIFFPISGSYTVTETDAGGYTTTYSINQGEPTTGTTASGTLDASGGHVSFVNTLEAAIPTGVDTPTASAFMCLCLAFAMMAISLAGRRLMRDEE